MFYARHEIEEKLDEAEIIYEHLGFDYYDCSIELYDVPGDQRLSSVVQKMLYEAGFLKIFVTHVNKWETHYSFSSKEFKTHEGWRVSYPHKRDDDGGAILVEKPVASWPEEWFKTGYVVVVKDQSS